jgi:hypothetical protein
MLEIVIGTFFAGVITGAVRLWMVVHGRRRAELQFHRDQFFIHVDRVLKNGAADDARLQRLQIMADRMDDAREVARLTKAIDTFAKDSKSGKYKPTGLEPPAEWSDAVFHYILAVSYLRYIRGLFLRAALAKTLEPSVGGENTEVIDRCAHPMRLQAA